ncbi:hypothetical protein AB6N24_14270 [Cellulomonas sp. 179-A 4D5 NHS]|uniref:hypothetical protein n=1 Tax=Cellulomonas sp. 179-A 4D5 NHS TaxID=3142378 RepID=UPI0039A0EDF2
MGERTEQQAVRVPLGELNGRFDLREVMAAIGPQAHLDWVLQDVDFNGAVTSVWPEGPSAVEARSEQGDGVPLDWATMQKLAAGCHQIVDGRFIGYDRADEPRVQLTVVDSDYWSIWADDPATLQAVRETFATTTDDNPHPEPAPPPRHRRS